MFGRRKHARLRINPPSEGTLRVLRDVRLQPSDSDELVAVALEPGVVGEILVLALDERGARPNLPLRVVESVPVVLNGTVRHRLCLQPVAHDAAGRPSDPLSGMTEEA